MPKYSKALVEDARLKLREWVKPGDTVHTILDHVSSSGMTRHIRLVLVKPDGVILHPNYNAAIVLGYAQAKRGDGLVVGGCGMDMGFHLVHSLGYALFGEEASKGTGKEANALRRAIFKAATFYMMQGGRKEKPDCNKPGEEWFGAAGYALKHQWL